MPSVFVVSDTHFTQKSFLERDGFGGQILRPFPSVEAMDEHMVWCWNSVVRPKDLVYHLGDVSMYRRGLPILSRLNGRKKLCPGNHDRFRTTEYLKYFADINAMYLVAEIAMTHIPVHPSSLRWSFNVHGHLHERNILTPDGLEDVRYFNVSVEQPHMAYTPIELGVLRNLLRARRHPPQGA